jgi:hypothetical protein
LYADVLGQGMVVGGLGASKVVLLARATVLPPKASRSAELAHATVNPSLFEVCMCFVLHSSSHVVTELESVLIKAQNFSCASSIPSPSPLQLDPSDEYPMDQAPVVSLRSAAIGSGAGRNRGGLLAMSATQSARASTLVSSRVQNQTRSTPSLHGKHAVPSIAIASAVRRRLSLRCNTTRQCQRTCNGAAPLWLMPKRPCADARGGGEPFASVEAKSTLRSATRDVEVLSSPPFPRMGSSLGDRPLAAAMLVMGWTGLDLNVLALGGWPSRSVCWSTTRSSTSRTCTAGSVHVPTAGVR